MQVAAGIAAGALLLVVAFGALALYARRQARTANEEREKANAQARVAQSRELASAAITHLDLYPELAVRLALESAETAPTAQAESALRQALFRWPGSTFAGPIDGEGSAALRLRELKGHLDDVMSVAFSPDGTRLLSVACDFAVTQVVDGRQGVHACVEKRLFVNR